MRAGVALAAAVLALAGCAAPSVAPRPEVPVPQAWRTPSEAQATLADLSWSAFFGDPKLEALLVEALANNHDLRIATERVELARAQYGIQRSYVYPTLAADASYQRQRAPGAGSSNTGSELATLGLALPTWEIDFWGRLRTLSESARRDLLRTGYARRALGLTLTSEVAQGYVQLVGNDEQIAVARRTLESREASLRLVQARWRGGVASALDVRQAEVLVATNRQTIADLERVRAQTENALAVLVGRNPQPIDRASSLGQRALPLEVPAGLPVALLERRPDLLAAEEGLRAAALQTEAARKAFLPTVSLTGFLGFISPELREIVEGRYAWSAQPAITLPLFTAGRLQSNVDASEASQRIALESYRSAVQVAFREVDDALVAYRRQREAHEALVAAVAAGRERLRLSNLRYVNGVTSYSEVLEAQRDLFSNELSLSQTTSAVYLAGVQLYRALGGGWPTGVPDAPATTAAPALS